MAKKKLEKEIIVIALLTGLTEAEVLEKLTSYGRTMKEKPDIVPGIKPEATVVLEKTELLRTLYLDRDGIMKSLKAKTEEILALQRDTKNIIVNQWVSQVQEACGNDTKSIIDLGFGIKGQGTTGETKGKATESHPVLIRMDMNVQLQQTLHIVNSETSKVKLPKDAKYLAVYRQVGGTPPVDIANMKEAGIAKGGKFASKFKVEDKGKTVYYILAYISKATLEPLEMSPVYIAIIN